MRDLKINETIFIENIDWEDETFGVAEDTVEYVTKSNHKLYVTYRLTLEVNWDGKVNSSLDIDEIYVENPFGAEIDLSDVEYDAIEENFRSVVEW